MAFLESYADEVHPGNWHPVGFDSTRNVRVRLRVRPESRELREDLDKKFQRPDKVRGVQFMRIPPKLQEKADVFQACAVWADTENFWVKLKTDAACALYKQELKLAEYPAIGTEVCIDGKLTDKLKEEILNGNMSLTLTILSKARLLEEQTAAEEEELTKN